MSERAHILWLSTVNLPVDLPCMNFWIYKRVSAINNLHGLLIIAKNPTSKGNKWRKLLQQGCHNNTQHKLNPKQCLQHKKQHHIMPIEWDQISRPNIHRNVMQGYSSLSC